VTSKAGIGADRDLPVNKETLISNEHMCANSCRLTFTYRLCTGPRPDTVQPRYTIGTGWLQCRSAMASCQWTQVTQGCKLSVDKSDTRLQAVSGHRWHKIASRQWTKVTHGCMLSVDTGDTRLQAGSGERWHKIASCQWRYDKIASCRWKEVTRLQAVSGNRWHNIASCQWT